jgi:hypothetical protein
MGGGEYKQSTTLMRNLYRTKLHYKDYWSILFVILDKSSCLACCINWSRRLLNSNLVMMISSSPLSSTRGWFLGSLPTVFSRGIVDGCWLDTVIVDHVRCCCFVVGGDGGDRRVLVYRVASFGESEYRDRFRNRCSYVSRGRLITWWGEYERRRFLMSAGVKVCLARCCKNASRSGDRWLMLAVLVVIFIDVAVVVVVVVAAVWWSLRRFRVTDRVLRMLAFGVLLISFDRWAKLSVLWKHKMLEWQEVLPSLSYLVVSVKKF